MVWNNLQDMLPSPLYLYLLLPPNPLKLSVPHTISALPEGLTSLFPSVENFPQCLEDYETGFPYQMICLCLSWRQTELARSPDNLTPYFYCMQIGIYGCSILILSGNNSPMNIWWDFRKPRKEEKRETDGKAMSTCIVIRMKNYQGFR